MIEEAARVGIDLDLELVSNNFNLTILLLNLHLAISLKSSNFCSLRQVKKCPSGIEACSKYDDCTRSTHYHKCDKCEKIKELQRCLAKKFPNAGIKDDGYWGCKTQDALDKLNMGKTVTPEQIEMLCTTTLG